MNRDDIERVRQQTRIEEVVARYLELRPNGRCFMARCPFHEDRSPSLAVFPHSQTWWCFGCSTGGDVFRFIERAEHLTFLEAVKQLAGNEVSIGRPLPRLVSQKPAPMASELSPDHFALLTAAAEVYHAALFTRPDLLAYLARRGLDAEAVRRFRIGYASGDDLERYFRYRGWDPGIARDLGLVGPHGEYFRERIVIPELRDGQAVYLVGRATTKLQRAKYIGLPGAPKPLYGQATAHGAKEVFVVEGPFDWLTLVNWGYAARGLLGAHLKREHECEFDQSTRIYLALDNDVQGRAATVELAKHFRDRSYTVSLPQGIKDVNELAMCPNGRARFERLVECADARHRGLAT